MSKMSNYLENALIDHVFRNSAMTSPAAVYLALFTSDPAEDASGAEVTEAGYAREAITFGAPSNGVSTNSSTHTFTAEEDWGEITHFALFDADEAGNMLMYAPVASAKTIDDGDSLTVAAAAITLTFQ